MVKFEAETIDGWQKETSVAIDTAYVGREKLPVKVIKRLFARIDSIGESDLFFDFHEKVRLPLGDIVALLWRIKEIEEAELAPLADDLFIRSVENSTFNAAGQTNIRNRIFNVYAVHLQETPVAELRHEALSILSQLEVSLSDWYNRFCPLDQDEQLLGEFVDQKMSLYWASVINLYQVFGSVMFSLRSILESMRFSLQMIGSPIQVNQETVKSVSVSLVRVVRVLGMMRGMAYIGGHKLGDRKRIEKVLDHAFVYPNYHLKLSSNYDRLASIGGEQPSNGKYLMMNVAMMKRNYLEQNYQEAQRFWKWYLGKDVGRSQERGGVSIGPQINCEEEGNLTSILPKKILALIRQALDTNMLDEAEILLRVYNLATNTVAISEYEKLDEWYRLWRIVEKRIFDQIQLNRRRILTVIK